MFVVSTLIAAALLGSPFAPRAVLPVQSSMVSVSATPTAFSPQAKLRAHETTVTVVPSVDGTLSVDVLNEMGSVQTSLLAATATTAGTATVITWDGAGVSDGTYGIHATLVDSTGVTSESVTPVIVDSAVSGLTLAALKPGLTAKGPVTVNVSSSDLSGLARATLSVENQIGNPLGTVRLPLNPDSAGATLVWDLRLRGRLLLPGVYHLSVRAIDGAGNSGESEMRVLRIDRPVTNTVIYSYRDAGRAIGLAFDDCVSGQAWLSIIKAFRSAKAHATFFCNGVNVRSNPDAARAALAAGDTIGSHTWSHPQMPALSSSAQASQIQGDKDIWWQVAKASPMPFFRPPYGLHNATTDAAAGAEGFAYSVLWDVDPSDYLDPPASVLVDKVTSHARAGSIVVMHVNANTASAVPALIAALRRDGLEPKSLDEMLGVAAYLAPRSN